MSPAPIGFFDDQIAELDDVAKALSVDQRGAFLQTVADRLRPPSSTGDLHSSTIAAVRVVSDA